MISVVVDTNILFSALLQKDSRFTAILLASGHRRFFAPAIEHGRTR